MRTYKLFAKRDELRKKTKRPIVGGATTFVVLLALIALPILATAGGWAVTAQAPINLGTADNFAVLAGSTITNTGPTTISGDVGLHPGSSVTGFDDVVLNGSLHVADAVADQAKKDLVLAYQTAAGLGPVTAVSTELGGQTLKAGVYNSGSGTFGITGTLTLDAQGNPDSSFVFKMATTLITATVSRVKLINGADPCNVFWKVGSSATLGTGTRFKGNILALASITLNTGAIVRGRALARNGAVTMDTNTITSGACSTGSTPPGSSTGTTESSTGVTTGSTDSSTGTTESSTGTTDSSTGSSTGSTDSSTGTTQSSTGTTDSSTGTTQSSTGTTDSSTGSSTSSTNSSTGTTQSSTGTTDSSTGSSTGTTGSSTGSTSSSTGTAGSTTTTTTSATDLTTVLGRRLAKTGTPNLLPIGLGFVLLGLALAAVARRKQPEAAIVAVETGDSTN